MRLIASLLAATGIAVHTPAEFQSAVERVRPHGGTIVLLRGRYDSLSVSGAFGGRLRIVGKPGARVQNLQLDSTRHVTVGPLRLAPLTGDALLQVRASRRHPPPRPHGERPRHALVRRSGHPRFGLGDRPVE